MIYLQTLVGGKTTCLDRVSDRSEIAGGKRCNVPQRWLGTAWVPRARLGPPWSPDPLLLPSLASQKSTLSTRTFDAQPHPPPPDDGQHGALRCPAGHRVVSEQGLEECKVRPQVSES